MIAQLIRARGFVATTTQEAGQIHNTDEEQLAYAVSQRKTLLTHNRVDFEVLAQTYFSSELLHCGIIIAVRRSPYDILERLLVLFNHVTADEMHNQVRYI